MREIKFKGMSDGVWFFGSLEQHFDEKVAFITWKQDYGDVDKSQEVDFDSVAQYTGIKDKHGIEIYENDIVNYTNLIEPVTVSIGGYIETYSEGHYGNGVHIHNEDESFVKGVSAFNFDNSLTIIGDQFSEPE
jgi:uncharacterized phage protein (TIGR01671 family)